MGIEAVEIDATALNVRDGPGTNHSIVDTVSQGEVYAVFAKNGDWKRIFFDERPYWIHGGYTKRSTAKRCEAEWWDREARPTSAGGTADRASTALDRRGQSCLRHSHVHVNSPTTPLRSVVG